MKFNNFKEIGNQKLTELLTHKHIVIDRRSWLYATLIARCPEQLARQAVEQTPAAARIDVALLDNLAAAIIKEHIYKTTSVSFATTLPPPPFDFILIATDIANYYINALWLCQKLAYLYGWGDVRQQADPTEPNLQLLYLLCIFVGINPEEENMLALVKHIYTSVGEKYKGKNIRKKFAYYSVNRLFKILSRRLGKKPLGQVLAKALWILGGAISAYYTYKSFSEQANRFQQILKDKSTNA